MSLYHDVMEALTPLVDAFDQLGIAYYIGGSVSSSLHGMARQSQDVDVIADIQPAQCARSCKPSRVTITSTSKPGKLRSDMVRFTV